MNQSAPEAVRAEPPAPSPSKSLTAQRRPSRLRHLRRSGLVACAFILPGFLLYLVFMFIPLMATVALSFTNWTGFSFSDIHIGSLQNYSALGHDPVFVQALVHTLVFVLAGSAIETLLALGLALVLFGNLPLAKVFRTIFVMPAVLSPVVIGLIFLFVLDPTLGIINPLLRDLGLKSLAGVWLSDPHKALPILVLVQVWSTFGLYMLLFIARLGMIPEDQWDSAAVDGASRTQTFRWVIFPALRSMAAVVVLLTLIDCLKVFNTVFVMTQGGPNHATEVLSTWAYTNVFANNEVGYGDAVAVVLLGVALLFIFAWAFWMRREAARNR